MTKEEYIADKREAITEQIKIIIRCVHMIKRISKYPEAKRITTQWRRILRIISYTSKIKCSMMHIQIIKAQPFRPEGGTGLHLVGNGTIGKPEIMLPKNQL